MKQIKIFCLVLLVVSSIIFTPQDAHESITKIGQTKIEIDYWVEHWVVYWFEYYELDNEKDILTQKKITREKVFDLILNLINHESKFYVNTQTWEKNQNCYSWGLMQILPSTAKEMGWQEETPENLLNIKTNLKYGIKYLCWQINRYKSLKRAVAAYNAGHTKYTCETKQKYTNQDYVDKVYHNGFVLYRQKKI